ncbi:g12133 [Coccomyxa viridis]|uniref:G12133 protein n=1 Tax=Coccomyxa viridis TaxID=1274662 RepID=A0ABP1G9Y2_9CHLO
MSNLCVQEPDGRKEEVSEAMSGDATADDDTDRRKRRSRSLDPTDSDSTGDSAGEEGGAAKVPLAAALEAAAEPPAGRKPAVPTAGQVVPRVDVQNKQLKGLLMLDQYPWMVKLLDGRTVSPSEFERLAGSLRKNWKSSTMVLQSDGRVGMNVGNWMDTMGIQNPAKTKNSGRGAPAQPAQASQPAQPAQANGAKQPAAAGTPGKRVRKAPNPEMHLAQLKALLESHGKKLEEGWTVEYTETKRDDRIDMDPYYYAPEGFVPDMTELPAGFSSKRYNSRKKVAQAHGIPASAFSKSQKSAQKPARAPDASAKPEARAAVVRKRTPLLPPSRAAAKQSKSEGRSPAFTETGDADNNHDKDEDDEDKEDYQPLAKRTRTAAAAEAILSGKSAAPSGPITPSTQTQKAGAQALLQLRAVDQAPQRRTPAPAPAPASASVDRAAGSGHQAAVRDLFTRVQTFINIVEIDADSLKRKHIRRYMEQAKAGLNELMELWGGENQELNVVD